MKIPLVERLVAALALALLAACTSPGKSDAAEAGELPFYATADLTAEWLAPSARASVPTIAPFAFEDQDGQTVTNATLAGKIYVANFFFTSCPSICPKMTASFRRIQAAYANDPNVALVSHTVDPESDTREVLARHARANGVTGGKWHLLTGDKAAIYTLARSSYFAEKRLGTKRRPNEFLHTESMLLVDGAGRIRGVYDATLAAEAARVIEDIAILRRER